MGLGTRLVTVVAARADEVAVVAGATIEVVCFPELVSVNPFITDKTLVPLPSAAVIAPSVNERFAVPDPTTLKVIRTD